MPDPAARTSRNSSTLCASPPTIRTPDRSRRNQSVPNSIANRRLLRSNGPSSGAQATFESTLARAKRLDARGNRSGCTRALAAAKRMYNLQ
jgi:hypothetical protein